MADTKIRINSLPSNNTALDEDLFLIYKPSSDVTNKITKANMLNGFVTDSDLDTEVSTINTALLGKSNTNHTHTAINVTYSPTSLLDWNSVNPGNVLIALDTLANKVKNFSVTTIDGGTY